MAEKILLADDNAQIRKLVTEVLTGAGFQVIAAADGSEALAKIYSENPGLCILDYEMPGKNGFEVVKEMRAGAAFVNTPVIIFTGVTGKSTMLEGLNLDIDDYLTKPADAEEIVARVKLLLRRNRQKISANPLTLLPGNPAIQAAVESKIDSARPFAVLYCDLNNFKSYNDSYGFEAGDNVIKATADILVNAVRKDKSGFTGHVGGDDFIIVCSFAYAEDIAKDIIEKFDKKTPSFYSPQDRDRGYIEVKNRRGEVEEFPFVSMGIGIVHNGKRPLTSFAMVSALAAEMKGLVKKHGGSSYAFDRRDCR